jgi:hypothetical protein
MFSCRSVRVGALRSRLMHVTDCKQDGPFGSRALRPHAGASITGCCWLFCDPFGSRAMAVAAIVAGCFAGVTASNSSNSSCQNSQQQQPLHNRQVNWKPNSVIAAAVTELHVDGIEEFSAVIVGAGTSGCTTAYLLAKWLNDQRIPGTVLLIDRGMAHSPRTGPDP